MFFDNRTHTWLQAPLARLAGENVYIGTSSWKYPGWCGQIYDESLYVTRKRFSEARFDRNCLSEYAETFPTVCLDAGYYRFPSAKYLEGLCAQVPGAFRFGIKVTDTITLHHFPSLPRFGDQAGKHNEHFLDADLFRKEFLTPCEPFREKIGVLIFEFSHFHTTDFERGTEFVETLDRFLAQLPRSWAYAVEIRNASMLQLEYFAMLQSHGVAHVFNSWTRMPDISDQLAMQGSFTTDFTVARFLLKPGRKYEAAVGAFSPYNATKEPNESARAAGRSLIEKARSIGKRPSFVFVNNRLEGNAPATIAAMLDSLEAKGL